MSKLALSPIRDKIMTSSQQYRNTEIFCLHYGGMRNTIQSLIIIQVEMMLCSHQTSAS